MVVKMNWAKHFRHLNWSHCPASCGAGYMCMNQCCPRTKSLLLRMHFYAYQKYTWHFCLRLGPFKLFKRPISLIGFLFMLAIKCSFFTPSTSWMPGQTALLGNTFALSLFLRTTRSHHAPQLETSSESASADSEIFVLHTPTEHENYAHCKD